MKFLIIDNKTNQPPDLEAIALKEDWAKGLVWCDMEGFAITDGGDLILMDECGKHVYCPEGRFKVIVTADSCDGIPADGCTCGMIPCQCPF
jgi:hypothetical protein